MGGGTPSRSPSSTGGTTSAGPCRETVCRTPPRSPSRPVRRSVTLTGHDGRVSAEDLENYEAELELGLYREYRDVVGLFSYVVETERRFYLANEVDLQVRTAGGEVLFELSLGDAWVLDVDCSAQIVRYDR